MAHFARLDENDIVTAVIVVDDAWLMLDGVEDEATGIAALQVWSGHPHWAQTSYNHRIRARYAGIGYTYDRVRDEFRPPGWTDVVVPEPLTCFVLLGETAADTRTRLTARWIELTHLLQMGLATGKQAAEHTLLSAHHGWLTS
jgi:hypothetical protein